MEVRRKPLIQRLLLGSGGECCDLELAVEVRRRKEEGRKEGGRKEERGGGHVKLLVC